MYYRETINKINENLKKSKGIYYFLMLDIFGVFSLAENLLVLNNTFAPSFVFSSVLTSIGIFYKVQNKIIKNEKYKEEHSEEYKELKELYDKYIEIVADVLSKFEYEDTLQISIALDMALKEGCFSLNNEYKFNSYKKVNEYFPDLIGTYVIEGNGVCRHNTAFISDVLNKIGIKNFKLYSTSIEKSTLPNHVLLGLVHNGQKFAYDFTNHTIGVINSDVISLRDLCNQEIIKYYITRKNNDEKIDEMESLNLTDELLACSVVKGMYKGFTLCEKFREIYDNNETLMNEITQKSLKLMPRR